MIRAFLAAELPAPLKATIAAVQKALQARLVYDLPRGVRLQWVRAESLHLTVKFLGAIPEEDVDRLKPAVASALSGLAPFVLEVVGSGVFPDVRAPRVLWLGLRDREGAGRLLQLAAAVEAAVETLGYQRDRRPFAPHLTIARIKEGMKDVGRVLARENLLSPAAPYGQVKVGSLALMQSDLQPQGAVYSRLWEVPLAGAAGE